MTRSDQSEPPAVAIVRENGLSSASNRASVGDTPVSRTRHVSDKKCSPGNLSFWQYKVYADIRGGSLERGRQMRVGSLKMAIFASFVHCLPNSLHTWPHDSFHVIRLSLTLAIFQDH